MQLHIPTGLKQWSQVTLTDGPCQICHSSLTCRWTFFLLQTAVQKLKPLSVWIPHLYPLMLIYDPKMTHFSDADGSQYTNTKNFRSRWRKSDIHMATLRNHLYGPYRKTSCLSSVYLHSLLVETTSSEKTSDYRNIWLQKNFTRCRHKLRKLASNQQDA